MFKVGAGRRCPEVCEGEKCLTGMVQSVLGAAGTEQAGQTRPAVVCAAPSLSTTLTEVSKLWLTGRSAVPTFYTKIEHDHPG